MEEYHWPFDSIEMMAKHLEISGWFVREEETGYITGSPCCPNEKEGDPSVTYQAEIHYDAESRVVEVSVATIFDPSFKERVTPELLHTLHYRYRVPGNLTLDSNIPEGSIVFTRIDHIRVGIPRRTTSLEDSIFRLSKRIESVLANAMNMGKWVAQMVATEARQISDRPVFDLSTLETCGSA